MLKTRKMDPDAMIDWRQKLLSSLHKLGERDTQKTAVEELTRIIEDLHTDTLPAFMVFTPFSSKKLIF